ncbi:MAG: cytochrome oxidase assembly protein [Acidobacteriales bacterium 59-55]|nr:COX15/CtaA family protein [Terriglobales bacterium]OJV43153.1 MAG: cytochrome oxidase assembly protein [Acidobacteriales bacterium 59-55]
MATVAAATGKRVPKALVSYAWVVVAYNVLVILWGAVVRATGSGAGCGDNWPLCNGDFFPHHPRLATIIEFAHRSMSGISTVLVIGLVIWVFYAVGRGHRARRAAVASVLLLVTEALLGAALVLGGFVGENISTARVLMQSIHFTNTMLFLGALSLTAWWLGGASASESPRLDSNADHSNLALPAWIAVIATIAVGATGSVAALADTLFPSPSLLEGLAADFASTSPLLVRMRWIHPAAAVVGLLCVVWLVMKVRSRLAWVVAGLLGLQFVLGIADVLLLAPTWIQIVHLLGADMYWIALVCLAAEALWGSATAAFAE